jgi:phosphate:Na+ symporter
MKDLVQVRRDINNMADLSLSMLKNTFDGFMKHDLGVLKGVLKDEDRLNSYEKELTSYLIDLSKVGIVVTDKKRIETLTTIISHIEQIGDYIKDMIERIEIKIEEKLLFSEEALKEYKELYEIAEESLEGVVNSLKQENKDLARKVFEEKVDIDKLLEKLSDAHSKRLIAGVCNPRAGNMYLNLLDFTAQIYNHSKEIAKYLLEI